MNRYAWKRVGLAIPTLLGVSLIIFALAHIMPGDPVNILLPEDASVEDKQRITELLGLDKPLPVQFGIWLLNAFQGNLGMSIGMRSPVIGLLGTALWNTFILGAAAGLFGFFFGTLLGTISAFRRGGWVDKLVSAIGLAGISVPAFWLAFLLIVVFSVELHWLPSSGMNKIGGGGWLDSLQHLIMPAIAIGVSTVGMMARMVRASMIQVLTEEFVVTLKAKGMLRGRVLWHIFRNVAPPVLTVTGLEIGSLLSGSVLVETIFNWPGIGSLLNQAIGLRDIPLIQGGVLIIALIFVLVNLLIDLVHSSVDPRIQRS
ncbi:ABC transporter permease [Paenibacillus sp.]|uniref:ABC transporter permease n=1 Tax=Paenibacillus TaxID=44249 RepID=UPI0035629E6D